MHTMILHRIWYFISELQATQHEFNGVARTLKKLRISKGRLLNQTLILYNNVTFKNGNFSQRKEFAPRGRNEVLLNRNLNYIDLHIELVIIKFTGL